MIVSLSLNAALGRSVGLPEGEGPIDRDLQVQVRAPFVACKATNAHRTVRALDPEAARLLLAAGGATGSAALQCLGEEGIRPRVIPQETENRETLVLARMRPFRHWEWKGECRRSGADVDAAAQAIAREIGAGDAVIVSGTPPALPEGLTWWPVFDALHRTGARVLLDSSVWRAVIDGGFRPWILKVNLAEHGGSERSVSERVARLRREVAMWDLSAAIVTAGERGALGVTPDGAWSVAPSRERGASPIGCGDAFAGGLVTALAWGEAVESALRWATACAEEAVGARPPGQIPSLGQVEQTRKKVKVKPL